MSRRGICAALAGLLLCACADPPTDSAGPGPFELGADSIGYFCNMIVTDHLGPKGQIHLEGNSEPIWFTSVRDTIAFTLLPGEPKNIAAVYVNDMGRATWSQPEPGTWVEARAAWYVIGSDRVGGMGAPEPVPFAARSAALEFAGEHGGGVHAFDDVPPAYVLAPIDTSGHLDSDTAGSPHTHGDDAHQPAGQIGAGINQ